MAETAPTADDLVAHTDWLMQLARALVGDPGAADIVQETYEVALAKPPKREGPLRPWLGGVARNLARMTTRGRVRRERREDAIAEPTHVPTPAELVERAQMHQQVARIVLELPEPLRATLLLRFFEGLSAAEIARAQGIPDATVRGRIKDALDRVRATLDQEPGGRKRWVLLISPLSGFAARDAVAATVVGGIAVKTSTKVGIALVVLILAMLGSRWAGWWGTSTPTAGSGGEVAGSASAKPAIDIRPSREARSSAPARQLLPVFDDDPKGTVRLEGQVIDDKEKGVGGAQVAIDSHPPRVITTEDNGTFVFESLMPRDYRLEATAGEGYAGPVRLRLSEKVEPVTLRIKKAGTVGVTVTEADGGKPVANATVELRSSLIWTAKTDTKGVAQLRGVGPVWAPLTVSANGFAPAAMMLSTSGEPGAPVQVVMALSRGAAIAGRVVDVQGKPIENARVVPTSASDPFPVVDPRRDGAMTKADGTFAITAVASGTWRLTASHPDHGPTTSPPITVDGAQARSGVELVMSAGGVVKGIVKDRTGKPIAAAEVRVVARGHVDWRARRQALTGGDGTFVVGGLPLRAMDVVASHDAGASAIVPADLSAKSEAEVTLTLDITGEINGTVVDHSGRAIGDAQVIAEPEYTGGTGDREIWSVRGIQEAVTDQGGKFKLTGLPDGNYRVRAARPGASEVALSMAPAVAARPGGAALKITLGSDGKITGKVALDGKAPARFFVEIGMSYRMPFGGGEGAFELPVVAGTHVVSISGPGFVEKLVRDVVVTDGKPTDIGTIVVTAGRSISGRVLDAGGSPVAKAKVAAGLMLTGGGKELYIADESPGAKDAETDDDGRFTLGGFPPFTLTLVAGKEGVGRSASVRIPSGPDSASLELVLRPTTGLDGKIVREGKPAADVVIIANPIGATGSNFFTTTGPDGTFALDALAPGAYIVYPMFGGGGPKPKDLYTRRVEMALGKRAKVEIDATPGTLVLSVTVKGADGAPAMAQVLAIEAAVEVTSLEDLRDGFGLPFNDKIIPIYMRGHMGAPVEITVARPGVHTVCTMAMSRENPTGGPFKCAQVKLEAGQPKKTLDLQLPKPKT